MFPRFVRVGNWEANTDTPQPAPAPDPAATAAAQTASNKATAQTQYELGATNQITPYGSQTYKQVGTWADNTPRFELMTSLSPDQQKLFDLGNQTQQNLGNIGVQQSGRIGNLLNTPFNIDASRATKLTDINHTLLDPQWKSQQDALNTQLFNSGVRPGSEAYNTAMRNFNDQKSRAYDQMYLDSYNTANQAALTERNQPINEITALLRGSGVQQPSFQQTPTPGVAPTDIIGAQQQALNQSNIGYQAQLAQNQGLMSGLFGLGKTGLQGLALGGWV